MEAGLIAFHPAAGGGAGCYSPPWTPSERLLAPDVFPGRSDRYTTAVNSSQSLSLVVDEGARTVFSDGCSAAMNNGRVTPPGGARRTPSLTQTLAR